MNVLITPAKLAGTVRVPASKSAAHRLLISAALADGPTAVRVSALNRDIEATLNCLAALGAGIERDGDVIGVTPIPIKIEVGGATPRGAVPPPLQPGSAASDVELDCGESGSTLRFLLPVACALGGDARVVGHGRLPLRPNAPLTDALRAHGARIDNDLLPMRLRGPIVGGRWTLPGDVSSQYVTGLLFALPLLDEDSEIALTTPLQSASYVAMTLEALRLFGIVVEPTDSGWKIPGGQRYHSPGTVEAEGDCFQTYDQCMLESEAEAKSMALEWRQGGARRSFFKSVSVRCDGMSLKQAEKEGRHVVRSR